ncbi:MAG: hypothetical protein EOS70_14980 [Mesorhizobium sp.]|nr:MAG: hypothetical protein EOS70_14980 [Mesorhizobium sp.]
MIGRNAPPVVILGRSKERSDAAQTPGSMPRPQSVAAAQNSAPLRPSAKPTAWIRRVASLLLRPGNDEVEEASANLECRRWSIHAFSSALGQ